MDAAAQPQTLQKAVLYFADQDRCLAEMVRLRWGGGPVICPTCGSARVNFLKSRRVWECTENHTRKQFSVKVGTIMEDSALGLDKWLVAMWLIANAKNGVSSYELGRSIGVTQKSAWFMLHRIRLAMQGEDGGKLGGEVEVDETYIGGKARNMHASKRAKLAGSRWAGKVAVMGLLERHGEKGSRVRTVVVQSAKRRDLLPHVDANVVRGANVYTDSLHSYDALKSDYVHQVVDHAEAYVDGQVHTNGMENYWSLLKRMLKGTYVSVEPFHLFRYLDEQAFRFNERKLTDAGRFAIVAASIVGKRLTFNKLTAADQTC